MAKEQKPPTIFFDHRETRSGRPEALELLGAKLIAGQEEDGEEKQALTVGDYVLSDRVGAEVKAIDDFLKSFLNDRKLYSQIYDLMRAYKRPILIIEGNPNELFTKRLITPEAMRSILQTIAISFRVPALFTMNVYETAQSLYEIAFREQKDDKARNFHPHGKRSHRSPKEAIEYSLLSLPNMGVVTGRNLLHKFGTIQAIANADTTELETVKNVGDKTAKFIHEFVRKDWNQEK